MYQCKGSYLTPLHRGSPASVNVGSVVNKVALGQISSLGRLRWDLSEVDHLEDKGTVLRLLQWMLEDWDEGNGLD
jgi:hypothetical protein